MSLVVRDLTVDCLDSPGLAQFWGAVLGHPVEGAGEGFWVSRVGCSGSRPCRTWMRAPKRMSAVWVSYAALRASQFVVGCCRCAGSHFPHYAAAYSGGSEAAMATAARSRRFRAYGKAVVTQFHGVTVRPCAGRRPPCRE